MANKIPVKAIYSGADVTSLGELASGDTIASSWLDLSAGTGITISGSGVIAAGAISLSSVQTAANQSAHLALTTEAGDIVVRSDENKTYCHNGGSAGTMSDFTLLATPTDVVLSVGGNVGAVTNAHIAAAVEAASDSNTFTDADHTKLNAIEASADVTDATNVTAAGALMDSELAGIAAVKATTGTFLIADQTKLDTIETSATADQTASQIKTLLEDGIDSVHYVDGSIDAVHLASDSVDSNKIANDSITNAMMRDDAIGVAELSASGTASSSTFLRGDNSWVAAGSTTLAALTDTTVSTSDPATNSNPSATGHLWVNKNSGETYVCTDATTNANVWFNIGDGADTYGADILIVAGGGGGGTDGGEGGGGGAGGMLEHTSSQLTPGTTYTVTVGAAGPGATAYTDRTGNGGDSGVTGYTNALGGGLGGNYPGQSPQGGDGNNGGSGGGGGGNYSGNDYGHAGGSGTVGQGNAGANGYIATLYLGGGGGGKGAAGNQGTGSTGGAGGVGKANTITGSSTYYAGGGGGNSNGGPDGAGGNGGGGANGSNGTTNTGGGGGAKGNNGGSGVVIIRVPTSSYSGTTTGSPTVTTDGSHKVLKFTGSGSYTA